MFINSLPRPSYNLPWLIIGALAFIQGIPMSWAQSASVEELIAEGARPVLLASGFKFSEGPAADASGNLYFTDIGSNRIHYWDTSSQTLSTIRENSGGADGLFVDRDGALWICELKDKQLSKIDAHGNYIVVADSFDDRPFTGPNDLWIDPYGGTYFSDSYGGSQARTDDHRVFYRARSGKLNLVVDNFHKSNGLHGTSNGRWLYVSDYIANQVYRYAIKSPGHIGGRRTFAKYRCDGMTLDDQSNLYICTGNAGHGVVVFAPDGTEIRKISFPENPSNVTFGGPDNKTLFVTATTRPRASTSRPTKNGSTSPTMAAAKSIATGCWLPGNSGLPNYS
jgi:gluconolactonase